MRSFVPEVPVENTPPPASRWKYLPRLSRDPETKAVQIGVLATILVHLSLYVFLPDKLDNDLAGAYKPEHMGVDNRTFSIELAQQDDSEKLIALPQQKPIPQKFVETNPDAPENEPDKTNNFGAQNQQAAQEKPPTKDGGDRPEQEGKKDFESTQIVSGNHSVPSPAVPLPPPEPLVQASDKPEQQAKERTPLPGFEKYQGANANAFGSNAAKIAPHPDDTADTTVEGSKDGQSETTGGKSRTVSRPVPKERPTLGGRARPAIFAENKLGTRNIGPAAIDARWSNYGAYLQKLIEAIDMQWRKLIESRSYPASGCVVTVKFLINSDGAITKVVNVESGMGNQVAERWCVSAITMPAPYGKWTEDMVAMLGPEQEMTFAFYYE